MTPKFTKHGGYLGECGIYFARGQKSGLVKVGRSTNVPARLEELRRQSGEQLVVQRLVHTFSDRRVLTHAERTAHMICDPARCNFGVWKREAYWMTDEQVDDAAGALAACLAQAYAQPAGFYPTAGDDWGEWRRFVRHIAGNVVFRDGFADSLSRNSNGEVRAEKFHPVDPGDFYWGLREVAHSSFCASRYQRGGDDAELDAAA